MHPAGRKLYGTLWGGLGDLIAADMSHFWRGHRCVVLANFVQASIRARVVLLRPLIEDKQREKTVSFFSVCVCVCVCV